MLLSADSAAAPTRLKGSRPLPDVVCPAHLLILHLAGLGWATVESHFTSRGLMSQLFVRKWNPIIFKISHTLTCWGLSHPVCSSLSSATPAPTALLW